MPRTSLRQRRIRWLKMTLKSRLKFRFLRELFGFSNKSQNTLDEVVAGAFNAAVSQRYHQDRSKYRKSRSFIFDKDLKDEVDKGGNLPWLNDVEFLQKYRCSRSSLLGIYDLIKDDPVFAIRDGTNGRQQLDAKMQTACPIEVPRHRRKWWFEWRPSEHIWHQRGDCQPLP